MLIPFGVDIHENQFLKNCEEYLKKNGEANHIPSL